MLAEQVVRCAGTAAFSRRLDSTITEWNESAWQLMASSSDEVVGRPCHEVMAGRDVFGNDFCGRTCACHRMALANRRIRPFRMSVTDRCGKPLTLRLAVIQTPGVDGPELVHLLEPAMGPIQRELYHEQGDEPDGPRARGPGKLTRRERDVLRLMTLGLGTDDIARQFNISTATVRNHISRCLHKLNAHSRVEAVSLAGRLNLV